MERKTIDKATGQSREVVKTDEELAAEEKAPVLKEGEQQEEPAQ